jgi:four helix bundle protein
MQNDNAKFKVELKKRLYQFTLKTIGFLDGLPRDSVSSTLGNQLLRSSTSIIGNFVEGQAASSRKDFTNFLNIALKSANESKLWFALLRDSKRVSAENVHWFLQEVDEISRILATSILTLKNKRA